MLVANQVLSQAEAVAVPQFCTCALHLLLLQRMNLTRVAGF